MSEATVNANSSCLQGNVRVVSKVKLFSLFHGLTVCVAELEDSAVKY